MIYRHTFCDIWSLGANASDNFSFPLQNINTGIARLHSKTSAPRERKLLSPVSPTTKCLCSSSSFFVCFESHYRCFESAIKYGKSSIPLNNLGFLSFSGSSKNFTALFQLWKSSQMRFASLTLPAKRRISSGGPPAVSSPTTVAGSACANAAAHQSTPQRAPKLYTCWRTNPEAWSSAGSRHSSRPGSSQVWNVSRLYRMNHTLQILSFSWISKQLIHNSKQGGRK